jgi:hypothetical protein
MKLIFSFSKNIGDYGGGRYTVLDKNNHVLDLYKVSMQRAKHLGHTVKFYGCSYSLEYLKGYYDTSVNVDDLDLIITDDLKIYIHSQEELGAVTIDGDIILSKKLKTIKSADIILEQKELFVPDSPWQTESLFKIINIFKKHNIQTQFSNFSFIPNYLLNVGILQFNNEPVKNLFLDSYYNLRNYYLENIEPIEQLIPKGLIVSTIICQYYFTSLCYKLNIDYKFTNRIKENEYVHLNGWAKFKNKKLIKTLLKEIDGKVKLNSYIDRTIL